MTPDTARLLADAVLLMHGLFVLFIVGMQVLILLGAWRGWGWVRQPLLRFGHLAVVAYVVVSSWLGVACPLTLIESELRAAAGVTGYARGFIADWVTRAIFYSAPLWVFTVLYTIFGLLVLASWYFCPPRHKRP